MDDWQDMAIAIFADRAGRWQTRMARYFGVTSRSVRMWMQSGAVPKAIYDAMQQMEGARK